jgi:hypothetical protein
VLWGDVASGEVMEFAMELQADKELTIELQVVQHGGVEPSLRWGPSAIYQAPGLKGEATLLRSTARRVGGVRRAWRTSPSATTALPAASEAHASMTPGQDTSAVSKPRM